MALQFQPFVAINPNQESRQERSLENLNNTIGNIGNQALQYRQQQIENQRQKMLMDLQGASFKNEWGYDPLRGEAAPDLQGAQPSGWLSQGTNGPQPQVFQPNYSMDSGGVGYVPQGSTTPIDLTSHFQNWKAMGQPMTYDHPDFGGGNSDLYSQVRRIPGQQNQRMFLSAQEAESQNNLRNAQSEYYRKVKGQPQNYLSSVSWDTATPQQQSMAKAMVEGNIRPSDLSFRDKGQIVALAQEWADMNGMPFQSFGGDIKRGTQEQFSYGKPAQNVNALNTALGHLDSLNTAFHDIQNTNQAWMNVPINKLRTMTNDPSVVRLDATLNAVQGEAANVFKGGTGATDQEIQSWRQVFNRNLTPAQAIGVIKQTDELFRSRLEALQYQRDSALKGGGRSGELLSPKGSKLMNKFEGQGNGDDKPSIEDGFIYTPGPGGKANKDNWKPQ